MRPSNAETAKSLDETIGGIRRNYGEARLGVRIREKRREKNDNQVKGGA
jgi:hypothetical protein